jgi:hypothetical protein
MVAADAVLWARRENATVQPDAPRAGTSEALRHGRSHALLPDEAISYHPQSGWFDEGPPRGPSDRTAMSPLSKGRDAADPDRHVALPN